MGDTGSTGLGFYTRAHAAPIWLRKSIPFRGAPHLRHDSGLDFRSGLGASRMGDAP
jgi:hypothetical protein